MNVHEVVCRIADLSSSRRCGRPAVAALIGALVVSAGCSMTVDFDGSDAPERTLERTQEELTRERSGTVIFTAENRNLDYNRTFRGYAASIRTTQGCSGAMIGPNVLMTASHCAGFSRNLSAEFRVHTGQEKYSPFTVDSYPCNGLLRMHDDTDLMLYWCPAKDGVNPGDKYGYYDFEVVHTTAGTLDVEASLARAVVDTPVRTFWFNPLDEPTPVPDVIFVSEGKVTSREAIRGWPSIQGGCNSTLAPIMRTNVWARSGVSGSATLSARNRIVGGPTSTAPSAAGGGRPVTTNAIIDYLTRTVVYSPTPGGRCDDSNGSQLHRDNIAALGLDWEDYAGAVDKNSNGLFDLHEDAEAGRMLPVSDFHWLGFESNRRNQAWRKNGASSVPYFSISSTNENAGLAVLRNGASLTHTGLDLTNNELYQLRGRITFLGNASLPISYGAEPLERPLTTLSGANGSKRFAQTFFAQGPERALMLGPATVSGVVSPAILLSDVMVARINATATFKTFDERMLWRTDTGKNALFVPLGREESSTVDFAMAVLSGAPSGSTGFFFSTFIDLCFHLRTDPRLIAVGPDPVAVVRINDVTGQRVIAAMWLTNDWKLQCIENVAVDPATAEIWFEYRNAGYLVDDVRVKG